jgi:hypothetical protein
VKDVKQFAIWSNDISLKSNDGNGWFDVSASVDLSNYYTKDEVNGIVGNLADLKTTNKDNLVNAINSAYLPTDVSYQFDEYQANVQTWTDRNIDIYFNENTNDAVHVLIPVSFYPNLKVGAGAVRVSESVQGTRIGNVYNVKVYYDVSIIVMLAMINN